MGKLWIGESNGCWMEIWDKVDFTGHGLRLCGPCDFPYLRVGQPHWDQQVRSILVGPNAYVQCYEDLNFHDSVFWLLPNQRVEDVLLLTCNDDIDSVRLYDRPPFAHEPGYSAYMLWAASHLSRVQS
jgi:Peptidase inhibitor family I36